MVKKKKIYKINSVIAPKVSTNRKWTVWREQETKARTTAVINELKKLFFKYMLTNNALINNNNSKSLMLYKVKLLDVIQKITKKSSLSFVKNYCFYVGRSRSTNRKVFMARHTFRKFARFGMLPGFIKERI